MYSFYQRIEKLNLSKVIIPDSIINDRNERYKHQDPLGFIGEDYQRFQIHFTSITKSKSSPYLYIISGKTLVHNNICSFTGTLKIVSADYDTSSLMKLIGYQNFKRGFITSQIKIIEDSNQLASGIINGRLETDCYFDDKGKIFYNALMIVADGFSNNSFIGNWTSFKTGLSKKCNWGDGRIPDCGDLDGGTGEFIPDEKYYDNGWRSYINSFESGDSIKAKTVINSEWWK